MENEAQINPALTPSRQANGWTIDRQRAFLEALAQCGIVDRAAGLAGMTRQSAYSFRQTVAGRAFDLAWDAALHLARQRMVDDAHQLAFEGSVEQVFRDGELIMEKRKRDPRMLLAIIQRLDDRDRDGPAAVRIVAEEFAGFLNAMQADAGGNAADGTAEFLDYRADMGAPFLRDEVKEKSELLRLAALEPAAPMQDGPSPL